MNIIHVLSVSITLKFHVNGLKGWFFWFVPVVSGFAGDPTSLAHDNILTFCTCGQYQWTNICIYRIRSYMNLNSLKNAVLL